MAGISQIEALTTNLCVCLTEGSKEAYDFYQIESRDVDVRVKQVS